MPILDLYHGADSAKMLYNVQHRGLTTDSLVAHGVVTNRFWFKLLARIRGTDRSVRAGAYEFAPRPSAWKVLDILAEGREASRRFTVPEGLTILDVAELAWQKLGIPGDSALAAARDSAAASAVLGFPVRSYDIPSIWLPTIFTSTGHWVHLNSRITFFVFSPLR